MEISKDHLLELTATDSERTLISRGDREILSSSSRRGSSTSMADFQAQREAAIATMRSSQVAWTLAAQEEATNKQPTKDDDEMVASNAKRPPRGLHGRESAESLIQQAPGAPAMATTPTCRTPPRKSSSPPPGTVMEDGDPMEYYSPEMAAMDKKVVTPDTNTSNNNNGNTPNNIHSLPGAYSGRPGADLERIGLFDSALLGMEAHTTNNVSFDSWGASSGSDKKPSPQPSPPRDVTWAPNIMAHGRETIEVGRLAQATPVDDPEGYVAEVVEDIELDPDAVKANAKKRRCQDIAWAFRRLLVLGLLGIAGIALLGVFVRGEGNGGSTTASFPTAESNHSSASFASLIDFLPDYSREAMMLPGEPQYQAWQWLIEDPQVFEYPAWRLRQRFSLATLYFATDGDTWNQPWNENITAASWLSYDYHECQWPSSRGSFIIAPIATEICVKDPNGGSELFAHLGLHRQGLQGDIPLELYALTSLISLDLGWNHLPGSLSSYVGQLTNLEQLVVPLNEMTGTVPSALCLCSNLKVLHLGNNAFSGSIPDLQLLTELEELYVFENQFHGSLPTTGWESLRALHVMMLDYNELTGSIPSELAKASNLQVFWAKRNNLTATIPTELGIFSSLAHLQLQDNQLTGTLPSQLGSLELLESLLLDRNQLFDATIPTEFGRLSHLTYLKININGSLRGRIPSELGQLQTLERLYLGRNALSGSIPSELGRLTGLRVLWLESNNLEGTIPTEFGLLQNLTELLLFQNLLTGPIPSELGQLHRVENALFDQNRLTGELPEEVDSMGMTSDHFKAFNVTSNFFNGTVPDGLCSLEENFAFDCSARLCGCFCNCSGPVHN